jgi:hypothetical protein
MDSFPTGGPTFAEFAYPYAAPRIERVWLALASDKTDGSKVTNRYA